MTKKNSPLLRSLGFQELSQQMLAQQFPPRCSDEYKAHVMRRAFEHHREDLPEVPLCVSRHEAQDSDRWRLDLSHPTEVSTLPYFFDNLPSDEQVDRWYVNFADSRLFYFYGSDLFAQDEIQTLEHPMLCALTEYLERSPERQVLPYTAKGGKSTPVLVRNVPYWVKVNTRPEVDGEEHNIYGNNFYDYEMRNPRVLDAGITLRESPCSLTNILAMCAPAYGDGCYTRNQMRYLLETTIVAFRAAKEADPLGRPTEIHTGRWGAGAFGGNEELTLVAQLVGAQVAGVERLVYHSTKPVPLAEAQRVLHSLPATNLPLSALVETLYNLHYPWGVGNGT